MSPTVFTGLCPADFPTERLAGSLHSVADAEHRNAECEQTGITPGGIGLVDAGRPTGQNDAFGGNFSHPFRGNVVPDDLAVDMLFADAAGNQLGVLGAEVEHKHPLGIDGIAVSSDLRAAARLGRGERHGKIHGAGVQESPPVYRSRPPAKPLRFKPGRGRWYSVVDGTLVSVAHPPSARKCPMLALLTNDDGIYAPGLAALEKALDGRLETAVVAPSTEQSGVGHAITFLSPLTAKEVFEGSRRRGWAVDGSPADAVKLGVSEFCPTRPDLVISGINSGLNAGINVLYSGTVAAAIEGAFFGITSIAVSLEWDDHADYERAARIATSLIERLLLRQPPAGSLFNINIPTAALTGRPEVCVVPMSVARYGEAFERRVDPRGRNYYWATNDPPPPPTAAASDITALTAGAITITPLEYDLTHRGRIEDLADDDWAAVVAAAD